MRKKRVVRKNQVLYESRKLIEYYKIADGLNKPDGIPLLKCTYDGNTFVIKKGKFVKEKLNNFNMPFKNNGHAISDNIRRSYESNAIIIPRTYNTQFV